MHANSAANYRKLGLDGVQMHGNAGIEKRRRLFNKNPRECANLMASVAVSYVLRAEWRNASRVCDEVLRVDPNNCNARMIQHRIRYSEAKAEAGSPVVPSVLVDRRSGKVFNFMIL